MKSTLRGSFALGMAVCVACAGSGASQDIPSMPMPIPFEDTIIHRWLDKPVLAGRLLDDMESLDNWSHQGFGQMTLTEERAKDGKQSLRLTSPTIGDKPGGTLGRPFGAASVIRRFDGEDWSDFNRLSFWVYPSLPGFRVITMCVIFHNDGKEKVPDVYNRNGLNIVQLEPDRWNHVVCEIAHLGRDKVSGVEFQYRLQGNEPGATATVCYDFDHLELQKVEADHFEGWDVVPGQIAYCHTGYPVGAAKTAVAADASSKEFSVIDVLTGKTVLTKPVQTATSHIGTFTILDFTEVHDPGRYSIRLGNTTTPPFEVWPDVWRDTIAKTINFFHCERCGAEVPGIHDVCHRDWRVKQGDKEIVINGGWHDAGDLSQGLVNTSEAVYAMFDLAGRLQKTDPALAARLVEEARWGLDWVLKTRFGDGSRCTWATMDFWTDGIMGTVDDVTFKAGSQPFENFLAASAEALASRMLKQQDAARARYCLQAAEEDWRFAREQMKSPNLELAAAALQSSIDLYQATGKQSYADEAFALARTVLDCQQQSIPQWDIPLTGFFYSDPRRDRILHYSHRGHEQAPIVGLTRLCTLFPKHPDWISWYAAIALYCEYYKTVAQYTAPYSMLPASIYRVDESNRATFREQVENGIKLGEGYYLRLFPVWFDFRGNCGTVLSQTKGLSAAARLRKDAALHDLCEKQVQWVLGRNPFCQSLMYGEGHDYAPQYTAMSGDMAGSLPVGIQTHFERDVPYWPPGNCYNYKEVWVHPSSRWLWLMCDLYAPDARPDPGYTLSQETSPGGDVTIRLTTTKPGETDAHVQGWNIDGQSLASSNKNSRTTVWRTRIVDKNKPWVAVVIPGDDLSRSRDIVGNFPGVK
jgi:hypothetical protein